MTFILLILIIITCGVIAFFVLIQNPKGGGLSGEFGGMGTQLMGAKQSTDVVEKGTWVGAAVLLVLILGSFMVADKSSSSKDVKSAAEKALKENKVALPAAPSAPTPAATSAPATATEAAPATETAPATGATPAPTNPAPAPADAAPATK